MRIKLNKKKTVTAIDFEYQESAHKVPKLACKLTITQDDDLVDQSSCDRGNSQQIVAINNYQSLLDSSEKLNASIAVLRRKADLNNNQR